MSSYPMISRKFTGRLKRPGIKSRLLMFAIILAMVTVILSFFWGEFGFIRMWILARKIDKLEKEIVLLSVQKQDLLWEIDKMKNDTDYIRSYAVEKYGYARPDQKIIQFIPSDSVRAAAARGSSDP